MPLPKIWPSPIFEKRIFPAENDQWSATSLVWFSKRKTFLATLGRNLPQSISWNFCFIFFWFLADSRQERKALQMWLESFFFRKTFVVKYGNEKMNRFWASKSNVRKKGVFANRLKHSIWLISRVNWIEICYLYSSYSFPETYHIILIMNHLS